MSLRAGYYGIKRFLRDKLERIAGTYDETIKSLFSRSEQAVLGAKNLLENHAVSKGVGGITYVVNADGSITWSGTHEGDGNIFQVITEKQKLPQGNYILTGCPSGGSGATYNLGIVIFDSNNTQVGNGIDIGSGFTFTVPNGGSITVYGPRSQAQNKTHTVSGTFYPMVRLATDTDATYAPYAMTNKELTDSASDQKTAINAIITAATGAADFAAFKTAMGAITPVTRSLSLTKEDITEEVKEDVEPEKTVTKKRTTKKTEGV